MANSELRTARGGIGAAGSHTSASRKRRRGACGRGPWPFADPEPLALPPALPNGQPWPRVSIITHSLNQVRTLEQAILSVVNQGYPDVEHIVIDRGSTDGTLEMLDRHRPHLAHVLPSPDDGPARALNTGFALATGEILTWATGDAMLAPGALAATALAFHTSGADLVAGMCQVQHEDTVLSQHLTCCENGPLGLEDLLDVEGCWLTGQFFYGPEVMFSRAIWERTGGRVDASLHHAIDYELWLRFAEHEARLAVIGRPVAVFRLPREPRADPPNRDRERVETSGADRIPLPNGRGSDQNCDREQAVNEPNRDREGAATELKTFKAELIEVRDQFLTRTGRTGRTVLRRKPEDRDRAGIRMTFLACTDVHDDAAAAHEHLATACALAGHDVTVVSVSAANPYERPPPSRAAAILTKIEASRPDLVVVGSLHPAAPDPTILGRVAAELLTALVLHDQWALTGRCLYTGHCDKHLAGCDDTCPSPDEYPPCEPDRIAGAWEAKRRAFFGDPAPLLLANNRWMQAFAQNALAAFESPYIAETELSPVEQGRPAIPLDVFRPRDQRTCRELLGLPQDRFVLLTWASHESRKSKVESRNGEERGHLARALERLKLPDVFVVSVGTPDHDGKPPEAINHKLSAVSYQLVDCARDRHKLAMLQAAADLCVDPRLTQMSGQHFIEAAACGTPVVAFPVGCVPETLLDGITGRIAVSTDSDALAEALSELYCDAELRANMGGWARLHCENAWSFASAYHAFASALARTGWRDRLGLRRGIRFLPAPPAFLPTYHVEGEYRRWQPIHGFGDAEAPHPAFGLPCHRWALGPTCRFEIQVARPGRHALLIECRNYWEGQRVRVAYNDRVVLESKVPVTGNAREHVLNCEFDLPRGSNAFDLHLWQWDATRPAFPAALLITSISLIPAEAARDEIRKSKVESRNDPSAGRVGVGSGPPRY